MGAAAAPPRQAPAPPVGGALRALWPLAVAAAVAWLAQWGLVQLRATGFAYWTQVLIFAGINVILAVSLNLVNGITGQFSIGHAGFMAVGAYASAFVTYQVMHPAGGGGVPGIAGQTAIFLASLGLGGALAAAVGYVVGLPSLRLRGDYLAIVTLGAGEIIRVLLENSSKVKGLEVLGGALGLSGVPLYTKFFWVWVLAAVTIGVNLRLRDSSHGRAFLSVRENEIAAEAVGVDTTRYKVRAFVIGAFFAGIAGGLAAHQLGTITPTDFGFLRSFEIVIMVVLGGMGSISGSVFAAVLLTFLPEALRPLQKLTGLDLRMVIYSVLLIVLMLLRPEGLFGHREVWDVLPGRRGRRVARLGVGP